MYVKFPDNFKEIRNIMARTCVLYVKLRCIIVTFCCIIRNITKAFIDTILLDEIYHDIFSAVSLKKHP